MKGVLIATVTMFLIMWGCSTMLSVKTEKPLPQTSNSRENVIMVAKAADGLDLQALGEMVKTVTSAEDLEKKINQPNGINNMDLNGDQVVDFIKVDEFGNGKDEFGFSLTTQPEVNEVQEVATIRVFKDTNDAEVQVSGNEQIYGNNSNYSYRHSSSPTTWLLMGYLLGSSNNHYRSPYYYGSYPRYYGYNSYVPHKNYKQRVNNYFPNKNYRSNVSKSAVPRKGKLFSPNDGKVAKKGIVKSLSKPTASQKSFQARSASKPVRSGGFGKTASSTSSSSNSRASSSRSSSTRSSSTTRSRSSSRSFGGRGK